MVDPTLDPATLPGVTEISKARILSLYPGIRPLAYRIHQDVYLQTTRKMNVTDGLRLMDQQLALYAKGRELVGGVWTITAAGQIVTNAKPGLSWHCYGLAFDSAWAGPDPYLKALPPESAAALWNGYGQIVKSHGMQWGGDFHLVNGVADLPHAEQKYGLTIAQAMELYQTGGLRGVWAFIDKQRGVPEGQDWNLGATA